LGKAGLKLALVVSNSITEDSALCSWLRKLGYKPLHATNRQSLLEVATQNAIDLVVITIPQNYTNETDKTDDHQSAWLTAITELRQMSVYKTSAIIAISDDSNKSEHLQDYLAAGVTQVIRHPLTEERFTQAVQQAHSPTPSNPSSQTG
jgi:CheY-like chemotaxis protein